MHRLELPGNRFLELRRGDLTRQDGLDAIVNAANPSLLGGGGVDGAIHRAGGPAILEECRKIVARIGRLEPGHAVATTAGQMPYRHVIHTAGPVWRGGDSGEAETLASCYVEAVRLADTLGIERLGFPSISTGIYGYPVDQAAAVALQALASSLDRAENLRLACFVLFDESTHQVYAQELQRLADGRGVLRR